MLTNTGFATEPRVMQIGGVSVAVVPSTNRSSRAARALSSIGSFSSAMPGLMRAAIAGVR